MSSNEKLVFISHKWQAEEVMLCTQQFVEELQKQLTNNQDKVPFKITLFCDFLDDGFDIGDIRIPQQDALCERADLALIFWSDGYDKAPDCQREKAYFLTEQGQNQPEKAAIALLEHGRFKDIPTSLTKRIFFTFGSTEVSLCQFWEKASTAEKFEIVAKLRDRLVKALKNP